MIKKILAAIAIASSIILYESNTLIIGSQEKRFATILSGNHTNNRKQ
jgi:hypothetical protein